MGNSYRSLDRKTALYFREQFRDARAGALRDAEGFQEILFALEKFGAFLSAKTSALGKYKDAIQSVAHNSSLAEDIPSRHKSWHLAFSKLYELVREARNDALHQGAFARHLTNNATQLAIILEDALMENIKTTADLTAADFMVREPVCASFWQPLSFIRQQMLTNSFTYLPVLSDKEGLVHWQFVSDYCLAKYLRKGDRKNCLAELLEETEKNQSILQSAKICYPDTSITEVLKISKGKPVLVIDKEHTDRLLGIITPFDLL